MSTSAASSMKFLRALAICLLSSTALLPAAAQQASAPQERAEIILRDLPMRGSPAYNRLLSIAGKDANGQILRLSQAEVWSMPTARVDDVIAQSQQLGVKTARLGTQWNHILKAPEAMPAMSARQENMMASMKSAPEAMSVQMIATPADPAIVEYALLRGLKADAIGTPQASDAPARVIFRLGDQSLTVRRTGVDVRGSSGCTWRGVIEETGEPVMVMWWSDGRISGMFTYRGRQYALKAMGDGLHAVVESDQRMLPVDHGGIPRRKASADVKDDPLISRGEGDMARGPSLRNPAGPDANGNSRLADLRDAPDQASKQAGPAAQPLRPAVQSLSQPQRKALAARSATIDMMVLYTPNAAAKYIDIDSDLVHLAIEQTNMSFKNSGIANVNVRLVHSEMIAYDESGGEHFDHLYKMVDGNAPFSRVRALRNAKKADVVILVVDDASGCGLSTRVAAEAEEAFAVVHHSCAALSYSIAHELGHIMGARHERSIDGNEAPFPFGHGYVSGNKWRDIMSYKQSCDGCPRQPFWSNPTMTFLGDPGGAPDTDNARVILEQAARVAQFR